MSGWEYYHEQYRTKNSCPPGVCILCFCFIIWSLWTSQMKHPQLAHLSALFSRVMMPMIIRHTVVILKHSLLRCANEPLSGKDCRMNICDCWLYAEPWGDSQSGSVSFFDTVLWDVQTEALLGARALGCSHKCQGTRRAQAPCRANVELGRGKGQILYLWVSPVSGGDSSRPLDLC